MGEEAKPKRAMAGFIVSLIGGILILVNALFLVIGAAWIETMAGLGGFGLGGLLTAWASVGLVFAILVIVGAVLIYMPGKQIIGGILVLIFSILSIIIGGGFFIGMILGIVGGALGLAKK